jgi:gallate dioxygenase
LRSAIESYPEDLSVAIVATGGLSHQVHGERSGFNNLEWDEEFLDLLEADPQALTSLTHAEYARRGGAEGVEVIMWLIMRGALSESVTRVHRDLCLPSTTTIGTLILENQAAVEPAWVAAHRRHVERQVAGIQEIDGTYPFSAEVSQRAYRLNDFMHRLIFPEHRERFVQAPEELFVEYGLTADERRLVETRDWIGLVRYGVIFFCLEKLAAVLGTPNAALYAQMRGETLEQYQKSRNVSLEYSVAGGTQAKRLGDAS